jgi:hypothetical protein
MLPTLGGRIQTRIFLLAVVGSLVTLVVVPFLPGPGTVGQHYRVGFIVLATVAVLGIAWECVYHFLMQWRWEKDWPTFFGFATLLNEGILVYLLVRAKVVPGIDGPVDAWAFWLQFLAVWIAVWLVANGPMRVPFLHWRFFGGRLI